MFLIILISIFFTLSYVSNIGNAIYYTSMTNYTYSDTGYDNKTKKTIGKDYYTKPIKVDNVYKIVLKKNDFTNGIIDLDIKKYINNDNIDIRITIGNGKKIIQSLNNGSIDSINGGIEITNYYKNVGITKLYNLNDDNYNNIKINTNEDDIVVITSNNSFQVVLYNFKYKTQDFKKALIKNNTILINKITN